MKFSVATILLATLVLSAAVSAQDRSASPPRFEGALVLMTGQAEMEIANDEAFASFFVEVQDADLAKAQSQVNQRVADATAALKRSDPKGEVQTSGYSSFPVYRNDGGRKIAGWRVRQGVTLRTSDLAGLARTVATAQQHVALGGIDFRVSRAVREKVDGELIQRAIANLNARVAAAAQALNVAPARIRTEELNFGVHQIEPPPVMSMARMAPAAADNVAEPKFEAGRSLQQMTVTAKVRFLQP
jgi:uncharacterized protein YggE